MPVKISLDREGDARRRVQGPFRYRGGDPHSPNLLQRPGGESHGSTRDQRRLRPDRGAENVIQALGKERNAVILPNHGTLCAGRDLREVLKVSYVVEKTAQVYIMAMSIGKPRLISEEDVREMRLFARTMYGQKPQAATA